jgi:hypothetical protein
VLEFLKTGAGDQRVKDIATRLRLTPFEGEQSPYKVGSVDVILERDQDGWLVLLMEDFIDFEVQEGERRREGESPPVEKTAGLKEKSFERVHKPDGRKAGGLSVGSWSS